MNDLPRRLSQLRNGAGLTLQQLSAATKVDKATLSRYETGKLIPRTDILESILSVYGYTLDIVPASATPEGDEAIVRLVQAGRALNDGVQSLLHDPNAGSLMERFTVLERLSQSFERIDRLVSINKEEGVMGNAHIVVLYFGEYASVVLRQQEELVIYHVDCANRKEDIEQAKVDVAQEAKALGYTLVEK